MKHFIVMFVAIGVGLALWNPDAQACMMHEEPYEEPVQTEVLEFAVFHSGNREVLVMSTLVDFDGIGPQSLGLITATPSLPDEYGTADPWLFEELYDWYYGSAEVFNAPGSDEGFAGGAGEEGLDVHPTVNTGPYEIVPIKVTGDDGVSALNSWLSENGFKTANPAIAQDYADRGWFFLAVKVVAGNKGGALTDGRLPPIKLSFESEDLVVPLRMESDMGPFELRLYLFFGGEFPDVDLSGYGMDYDTRFDDLDDAPSVVSSFIEELEASGVPEPAGSWHPYRVFSIGDLNKGAHRIEQWESDFRIPMVNIEPDTPDDTRPPENEDPAPTASTSEDGGGGCATYPHAPAPSAMGLLFLLFLALSMRRGSACF